MASAKEITLYHCRQARSFRVLWTLHEMGLKEYELLTMPFPPRFLVPGYTKLNPVGTIPFFTHGDVKMTESCGIPLYLVEKFGPTSLQVKPEEPDYGAYLNWITHADATLTFPQTVFLRFVMQEAKKGLQEAGHAYAKWFIARLKLLDQALADGREFLCSGRFTIADICIAYALRLGASMELDQKFGPYSKAIQAYVQRMESRPAFKAAVAEEDASEQAFQGLPAQSKL